MHPVYVFCNYALYNIWPIFPGHKTCILCQTLIVPNSKAMFNSHVLNVGNRNVHPSFSFQCMGDRLWGSERTNEKKKSFFYIFLRIRILCLTLYRLIFILNLLDPIWFYIKHGDSLRAIYYGTMSNIGSAIFPRNCTGTLFKASFHDFVQNFEDFGFLAVLFLSKMYNSGKTNFKDFHHICWRSLTIYKYRQRHNSDCISWEFEEEEKHWQQS